LIMTRCPADVGVSPKSSVCRGQHTMINSK